MEKDHCSQTIKEYLSVKKKKEGQDERTEGKNHLPQEHESNINKN